MAKLKYYAVKNGKIPGIYESWEECKKMIDGFSNAAYKAFGKKEDAEDFMCDSTEDRDGNIIMDDLDTVIAYVDGSYSDTLQVYSFGCVLLTPSGETIRRSGNGNDPEALNVRNVAGELQGAMHAVKLAYELGYKRIIIRHDYIGIARWYTREWKARII
jgi:viroplasmin and RNaseH domain-containing protein